MAALLQLVQIQEGHNLRRERIFRDRTHPLDTYIDEEIRCRYRLSREMIMNLHNMIADDLEPHTQRNHAIPAINQIFLCTAVLCNGILPKCCRRQFLVCTDLLLVELLLESQVLFADIKTITFSSQLHKMELLP